MKTENKKHINRISDYIVNYDLNSKEGSHFRNFLCDKGFGGGENLDTMTDKETILYFDLMLDSIIRNIAGGIRMGQYIFIFDIPYHSFGYILDALNNMDFGRDFIYHGRAKSEDVIKYVRLIESELADEDIHSPIRPRVFIMNKYTLEKNERNKRILKKHTKFFADRHSYILAESGKVENHLDYIKEEVQYIF